jgi:hypothetical protein
MDGELFFHGEEDRTVYLYLHATWERVLRHQLSDGSHWKGNTAFALT